MTTILMGIALFMVGVAMGFLVRQKLQEMYGDKLKTWKIFNLKFNPDAFKVDDPAKIGLLRVDNKDLPIPKPQSKKENKEDAYY